MKTCLLTSLVLLCCSTLSAQCPTGDVALASQNEVIAFAASWPHCDSIHGDLLLGKADQSSNIENLTALSNIRHIEGSLSIRWNLFLENLYGLDNLETVGKSIDISKNQQLTAVNGLERLEQIGESLSITENPKLTSLTGLSTLHTLPGSLKLEQLQQLTDLQGLNNLSSIGGDLQIHQCGALADLNGLDNLTFVGKDLSLFQLSALRTVSSLSKLERIGGGLHIVYVPFLTFMTGLEQLRYASSLLLTGNDFLIDVSGMSRLRVEKEIALVDNLRLEILHGLSLFAGFRGDLRIVSSRVPNLHFLWDIRRLRSLVLDGNPFISNLTGLENLQTIDSSLSITRHPNLTDLNAFDRPIVFTGEKLTIAQNPGVSNCAVEAVCNWLGRPDAIDQIDIRENGPSCTSRSAVEKACFDAVLSKNAVVLSPNPCHHQLEVLIHEPYAEVHARIRDVSGRVMAENTFFQRWQLDTGLLSAGVYFVEIEVFDHRIIKKVVKI